MAAEVPLAAMIAMIRIMMMTVLLEDESHSRGAKSGTAPRVLGVGMMMIVTRGGLVGHVHRGVRKEARIGRADLRNGEVPSMHRPAGAAVLGASHQTHGVTKMSGVTTVPRRLLTMR